MASNLEATKRFKHIRTMLSQAVKTPTQSLLSHVVTLMQFKQLASSCMKKERHVILGHIERCCQTFTVQPVFATFGPKQTGRLLKYMLSLSLSHGLQTFSFKPSDFHRGVGRSST